MHVRYRIAFMMLTLGLMGCTTEEFTRFWDNPFQSGDRFDPTKAPLADPKVATRVHSVGSGVMAANGADIEVKPIFFTLGVAEPMLFHQSDGMLVISEGLVKRCNSDAELAALLSHQIAEMTTEKHERDNSRSRERELPPSPRLTPDVTGSSGAADMTRAAEEGYYGQRTKQTSRPLRASGPETTTLAKSYLQKAGYDAADYARVEGLVREAEKNAADRSFMRQR